MSSLSIHPYLFLCRRFREASSDDDPNLSDVAHDGQETEVVCSEA